MRRRTFFEFANRHFADRFNHRIITRDTASRAIYRGSVLRLQAAYDPDFSYDRLMHIARNWQHDEHNALEAKRAAAIVDPASLGLRVGGSVA